MPKFLIPVLAILCVLLIGGYFLMRGKDQTSTASHQTQTPTLIAEPGAGGGQLKVEDVKVGDGTEAVAGKLVTVHYTGTLTDGKKFDSSVDRKQPFQFRLGAGNVIPGWEQGVSGMKVGGQRKLIIPSQLGYGERGAGGVIPPNATLLFDIELLKVE